MPSSGKSLSCSCRSVRPHVCRSILVFLILIFVRASPRSCVVEGVIARARVNHRPLRACFLSADQARGRTSSRSELGQVRSRLFDSSLLMHDHMKVAQMFVQLYAVRFRAIQARLDARSISDSVAIGWSAPWVLLPLLSVALTCRLRVRLRGHRHRPRCAVASCASPCWNMLSKRR